MSKLTIQDLFVREISRPINGVVKADQQDSASVWQELDEFVVTTETRKHLNKFFTSYLDAIKNPHDANITEQMGVWVSGFFGSGKSHFIKVLSYLLRNELVTHEGQTKQPIDFFESKVQDSLLYGEMTQAVKANTDVILFNISSKANATLSRDAILEVFLRVFNQMEGFSPDHPHIAHMERNLREKGQLDKFHASFQKATGKLWLEERDAYDFHRDEIAQAFSEAIGQSLESASKWLDNAEKNFPLTIENFGKWVNDYLTAKGPHHRIIFLADEVGQYIGGQSQKMLDLQTITENLGTICKGRAWLIVTSQEDIDTVLGEQTTNRMNDFSKIQGRFKKNRLSLSSANVDEVIQTRLLAKKSSVVADLETLYRSKSDIIKNQLTFTQVGMTFHAYKDPADFAKNYPFAPYQFQLIQKIFESIRKVGAAGTHLARGERSLLDAFQSAAKEVSAQSVGILVPLYRFYPAIENFLDTFVQKTIEQASTNPSLEPFDMDILKVLFLIRYVEEVKGSVDNLVTLCVDQVDTDRHLLRKKIEASLIRLEKETLISRNGDLYQFLTNEERDISREIKNTSIDSGEESRKLGEILFEDLLGGIRKHRYKASGKDFSFNRFCDSRPIGNRLEGAVQVRVITPLGEDYANAKNEKCILESSVDGGQLIIRLPDDETLGRELRVYLKTDRYVRNKNDGTISSATKRILGDLAEENRQRQTRIKTLITQLFLRAGFFAAGATVESKSSSASQWMDEALDYLIRNTFPKMSYIRKVLSEPLREIQAILRSNDIGQQTLIAQTEESNPQALQEVRQYIDLSVRTSKTLIVEEMASERFSNRPFGWPEWETVLLLARLSVLGEIQFVLNGAPISPAQVYEKISAQANWKKITVVQRKSLDTAKLQSARSIGQQLFSQMGPEGEDSLFEFTQSRLREWETKLGQFKPLADTGNYPGATEIQESLTSLKKFTVETEGFKFLERFVDQKKDLLDLSETVHQIEHFYINQKRNWEELRGAHQRFILNQEDLMGDPQASQALKRIAVILGAKAPYEIIKEANGLIQTVEQVNQALILSRREKVYEKLTKGIAILEKEIASQASLAPHRDALLAPLNDLRTQIASQESLAHLAQAEEKIENLTEKIYAEISGILKEKKTSSGKGDSTPVMKVRTVIKPSELVNGSYLETPEQADDFIKALQSHLKAALFRNERIQIK